MRVILETSESGRRPITVFAALVTVGALGFAAYHDAPWFIWAIWGPCAALMVWIVVVNRVQMMQVCEDRIRLFDGRDWQEIHLVDIDRIDITTWSDGADTGSITATSGAEVRLFAGTIPHAETMAGALVPYPITVFRNGTPVIAA